MGLEARLVQKLSQQLLMTPQLQQAIKLLQLGRLEYKEALEKELLENPILEESKDSEEFNASGDQSDLPADSQAFDSGSGESGSTGESEIPPTEFSEQTENKPLDDKNQVDWEGYLDQFSDYRGSATPKGLIDHEDRPSVEATLTKAESLEEHLISQIRFTEIDGQGERIALHVIGNLDKDGYLCSSKEEIAQTCGCSSSEVERVVKLIQNLDPPGVAARDLKECLLIQLDTMGLTETLEAKIVRDHLDKLEKRKYDLIAKAEQVAIEQVYKAVTAIQNLEPRPGRSYTDETIRYIVPDIYVYKVGSEYVISLNEDGMPKLRVSSYYLQLLKSGESENLPNKAYLNERLKAAQWLIKSIHQRQQTIYRVTESIVKFQRDFLDHGITRLKPLVLKAVADDIGMHESTVSRVTTNKYVHTPQGVFELKYFFTTGIKTDSGDISASSVKERIKNIILAEPADRPISDQEIVDLLKKENITIARRTVAKYRESLGILSSSKRKRLF